MPPTTFKWHDSRRKGKEKLRGDLSGSSISGESLVCSSRFGAQVLNSAVGSLLPHLSYLTLRNTSSTYSHTNIPQRSFRPNRVHTKKMAGSGGWKQPRNRQSVTVNLFGKVEGCFFPSLTLKYHVWTSATKENRMKNCTGKRNQIGLQTIHI